MSGGSTERDVELRDGRTLHVYDDGDPAGFAVVVHHGTPGGGLPYGPHAERARAAGIRMLAYDRAGYGRSTAQPGRSVADVAADLEDVLDALAIDRCASLGGSGGGPHTLALGALLAGRCVATCAIACPAPWEAEGLDWLAGQGEQNRAEWAAALEGPEVLDAHLERDAAELRGASAEQLREVMRRCSRRRIAQSSRAGWPSTSSPRRSGRSSPASPGGATTTSRSHARGASSSPRFPCPSSSGRASRT